ncbi:MAG: HEAT repeat domain-containing protein [Myxococcota bacterium]|nr:HEAT repeat domain-containing protein [Myxococcota bacterium]
MGFFDLFTGGSIEKQIEKHAKRIKKKDAQQEDRVASAYWLSEEGSFNAVYGLLGRFEMAYEHQMKDRAEKDLVSKLLEDLGEPAVPAIKAFLRKSSQFARPMALLETISGKEEALKMIFELLDLEAAKSELKPGKKRQLLIKLAEFQTPEVVAGAVPFLSDFDEGVRFAAVEVLIAQEETAEVRETLLSSLSDPEEESNRLRVRISEIASARRWTLGEHQKAIAANPPSGWAVAKGRLLPA